MADKIKYLWKITTISPLHIGTGERLREGFDFIEYHGRLWIANHGALMRTLLEEAEKNAPQQDLLLIVQSLNKMTLTDLLQAGWLRQEHFDAARGLFRYPLQGTTSTKGKRGELLEQLKDVYGRPYLPGSSLKGALRSELLRFRVGQDGRKPIINYPDWWQPGKKLKKKEARVAAQKMEQRHFVHAHLKRRQQQPNFDLWKAFQVGDSTATSADVLRLGWITVFPVRDKNKRQTEALTLDAEVIPAGIDFESQISVDDWYFKDSRAKKLDFRPLDLNDFTVRLRDQLLSEARTQINQEYRFFVQLKNHEDEQIRQTAINMGHWYKNLADKFAHLGQNEFLLQIGMGTGWLNKTLGRVLQEKLSPAEFETLVQTFGLGNGQWKTAMNIPLTRKICSFGGAGYAALGWIKISLEQVA